MLNISEERMRVYRASHRRRERERDALRRRRQARAWDAAKTAADILRRDFGAGRVIVVGSLATSHFDERSDIDLITWGIKEDQLLRALSAVQASDFSFSFDLMRAEELSDSWGRSLEDGTDI